MTQELIPGIPDPYSVRILRLFDSLPADAEVILFGSRVKGNFREGSDIDLAIKGKTVSIEDRDRLSSEYENLFMPWKLDLVIYDLIEDQELRSHIDRLGKQLRF